MSIRGEVCYMEMPFALLTRPLTINLWHHYISDKSVLFIANEEDEELIDTRVDKRNVNNFLLSCKILFSNHAMILNGIVAVDFASSTKNDFIWFEHVIAYQLSYQITTFIFVHQLADENVVHGAIEC